MKQYIETYVRNNPSINTPSGDSIFRRIKDVESDDTPESFRFEYYSNTGSGILSQLIDSSVKMAISPGSFSEPVNVAIN